MSSRPPLRETEIFKETIEKIFNILANNPHFKRPFEAKAIDRWDVGVELTAELGDVNIWYKKSFVRYLLKKPLVIKMILKNDYLVVKYPIGDNSIVHDILERMGKYTIDKDDGYMEFKSGFNELSRCLAEASDTLIKAVEFYYKLIDRLGELIGAELAEEL